MAATLNAEQKQTVSYVIPLWLRDEQIRVNIKMVRGRIGPPVKTTRPEPIAIVGFGHSLTETWEQLRDFKYIITCSGSHRFLLDHGIVPTWHVDVDPQPHKAQLIGQPHPDVEYLIASTCHPDVFKLLEGFNVKLWHVFDTAEEGLRILPPGEYALTGGPSVGLRAMTMARYLGFVNFHLFGMDGCDRDGTGKHAAFHPKDEKRKNIPCEYDGVTYLTTPSKLEVARATFHELNQMPDVKATFYGEGLTQHMARNYVPSREKVKQTISFEKPELISKDYVEQNKQLHLMNLAYGVGAGRHAETVLKLAESIKTHSILDYGCGKGYLAKKIDFPIWEYDPAIEGKSAAPRPADLVVCLDVLEHIEPDKLKYVLKDLARCTAKLGYFVINMGPAMKTLPDGRNTHLIQENEAWWKTALSNVFAVAKVLPASNKSEIHVLVEPLRKVKQKAHGLSVKALTEAVRVQPFGMVFGNLVLRHSPYLIGLATNVLNPLRYDALTSTFPMDLNLYKKFTGGDEKYSLSERNNPDGYAAFVNSVPAWKEFHAYVKTELTAKMQRIFKAHKIQMDLTGLSSRFEFSLLPADGGLLRPHTDLASKVVTLVLSMQPTIKPWDAVWGGGTDVLEQVDASATFADYEAPEGALKKVHTYDYAPNQCVVFVKSEKSWHSVGPLTGPEGKGKWRRTVTINLERA